MKGYALRYAFWALLLFALFYFKAYSPLFFISDLQTDLTTILTARGVDFLQLPVQMDGIEIVLADGLHLRILHECNAMAPLLLFAAAVWSYPTALRTKALWTFVGYLTLVFLNIARIMFVLYVVDIDRKNLEWSHHYVGRYGMGVLTLALFWVFTEVAEVKGFWFNIFKKEKK